MKEPELTVPMNEASSCRNCPYKLGQIKTLVNPCISCPLKKGKAARGAESLLANTAALFRGEKSLGEAAADTLKDIMR
ncbi:hypothetical protein IJT93_05325 [bacterium]|nr:hypothetical protein [bacterium]